MIDCRSINTLCIAAFFFLSFTSLSGQMVLSEIFTDHMVLQRDQPIRIWGWSEEDDQIEVDFDGQSGSTICDQSGRWEVVLPKMQAGGPYKLRVRSKNQEIELSNILIGDVWLCSGQSNMEWVVNFSNNAADEIARAGDQGIRHFKVPRTWSKDAEDHLEASNWQVDHPDNAGNFTAVGYFFAREMREHHDVPIGLLNSSWGGSRIEPWMSPEALSSHLDGDVGELIDRMEAQRLVNIERLKALTGRPLTKEETLKAMQTNFDDSNWANITVPGLWEDNGFEGLDGTVYLRKEFELSEEESKNPISLSLGMIDDSDWTYINGKLVGTTEGWNEPRHYSVSSDVLVPGKNVILIKVVDTGGGGGLYGDADKLYVETPNRTFRMMGEWKIRIAELKANSGPGFAPNQVPVILYNKMIHPILPFAIKGVLWYQGESNASPDDAGPYADLFKSMINDWRARWGLGDFPFLWVQLANFQQADEKPTESSWALLRESQTKALELPNTGQAVIIDIGEADDIHPRNKQDVGYRLSLAARHLAFGEDIVHSGPVFRDMEIDGSSILIEFDHRGSGLKAKGKYGYLKGFAIADNNGQFVWAQAAIEGQKVRVWSNDVPHPRNVRYAWGINPDDANLYNKEGLPACPFKTD